MKQHFKTIALAAVAAVIGATVVALAQHTNYLGTVFIADTTTPTQQLKVNSDGSINVTGGSSGGSTAGVVVGTASVAAPGTAYVPGTDTATAIGGTYATIAAFAVTDTQVVTAATVAGHLGTSCSASTGTLTGTTGTGTKFQITATFAAGAITGVTAITVHGDYTVNPTTITAEPVSGNSCSGVQIAVTMGALKVSISNAGNYTVTPTNPVSLTSTAGSGSGLTLTLSWASTPPSGATTVVQPTAANLNMTEANSAAILSAVQGSVPGGTARIGYTSDDVCTQKAKSSAVISVATATTTSLVAVSGSTSIYICGLAISIAGSVTTAATASLEYGTSTNCTGTTALTGTFGSNDAAASTTPTTVNYGNGGATIAATPGSQGVCIVTTGNAVFVQGILTYVQQ